MPRHDCSCHMTFSDPDPSAITVKPSVKIFKIKHLMLGYILLTVIQAIEFGLGNLMKS